MTELCSVLIFWNCFYAYFLFRHQLECKLLYMILSLIQLSGILYWLYWHFFPFGSNPLYSRCCSWLLLFWVIFGAPSKLQSHRWPVFQGFVHMHTLSLLFCFAGILKWEEELNCYSSSKSLLRRMLRIYFRYICLLSGNFRNYILVNWIFCFKTFVAIVLILDA